MSRSRRSALIAGVFFLITFVSAIVGVALYVPLLGRPDYVLGSGADAQIAAGALCEIVLGITNIGTAVVLFPTLRRWSEGLALGYVASRIVESVLIAVGILALLSVTTLRQQVEAQPGADTAAFSAVSAGLLALHGWTFLLGPGFLSGVGNGLLLGALLHRSGLVPRRMTLLGLIGGPLVALSGICVLFGLYAQSSVWSGIATVPEFVWEAFLGLYFTIKGFRTAPLVEAGLEPAVVPVG